MPARSKMSGQPSAMALFYVEIVVKGTFVRLLPLYAFSSFIKLVSNILIWYVWILTARQQIGKSRQSSRWVVNSRFQVYKCRIERMVTIRL